jgi:FkbM family methyltransferase
MEFYIKNMLNHINYNDGFFIECGANDGITQSYTYHLENKNNWSGILIEPSEFSFNMCKKNRSNMNYYYNCALVESDEIKEIYGDFNGSLMASVDGQRLKKINNKIKVNSKTITSILNENNIKNVDLFSIDVEGFELNVLKGLDFNQHKPKFFIIEIYEWDFNDIKKMLENNGYLLIESLTNYNKTKFPKWDGTHNDFIFKLK